MALRQDFYTEIFEQEKKWIELINSKLLNSVYCKYILQPFYLDKKKELEQEYFLTQNDIIGNIIGIIDSIIGQTEVFNEQFISGEKVDINLLIPLFLTTKMTNTSKKEEEKSNISQEINELQIKKQLLENQIRYFDKNVTPDNEYVYDDFPEEKEKVK